MLHGAKTALPNNFCYFFFALPSLLAADGLPSLPLASAGLASPITPFKGQILKAGHFSQPVTMAIGQRVMVAPVGVKEADLR